MPARRPHRRVTFTIPHPTEQPTISVEEAGRFLGLGRASAYHAANRGEIPIIRIGKRMRVPTAELRKMLGMGGGQGT